MPERQDPSGNSEGGSLEGLLKFGRVAWAIIGIGLLVVAALYATQQIMVLAVPVALALFPAALLEPMTRWLTAHRVPAAVAALMTIVAALAVLAGIVAALVPLVQSELPQLIETGEQGLDELRNFLDDDPLGVGMPGLDELTARAQEAVSEFGDVTGQAFTAVTTLFEAIAATLLLFVVLFFYLKDGSRIADALGSFVPARLRPDASAIAGRLWETVGGFFRGQLIVAAADAVFIGLGLWVLDVPLALPLAVLIFFGALFPIVGAFVTGTLAVLVALADAGVVTALLVLALIVAVQQLEGNVLQPVVLGRVVDLHPLVVIAAVTGGALVLGILGAFLAVPIVASFARVVEYLREPQTPLATRDDEAADHPSKAAADQPR